MMDWVWKESKLERAFFLLFDGTELAGLVRCHVDDLFAAGNVENKVYRESIEKLPSCFCARQSNFLSGIVESKWSNYQTSQSTYP